MNTRPQFETPLLFCVTGELRENATVRTRPVGDNNAPMPVLTMVLHKVGPLGKTVIAEQVFPFGAIAAAHARAKELKKGTQLQVQAPIDMIEMHLHAVAHVHQVKEHHA